MCWENFGPSFFYSTDRCVFWREDDSKSCWIYINVYDTIGSWMNNEKLLASREAGRGPALGSIRLAGQSSCPLLLYQESEPAAEQTVSNILFHQHNNYSWFFFFFSSSGRRQQQLGFCFLFSKTKSCIGTFRFLGACVRPYYVATL